MTWSWGLAPGESRDLNLTYWATDDAFAGLREPQDIVVRSGNDGAYEDVVRVVLEVVES